MADNSWVPTSTPLPESKSYQKSNRVAFDCSFQVESPKSRDESQSDFSLAHRTRALFNVISRPPLLCAPSYGIKLPFSGDNKSKAAGLDRASDELKELACSDSCLLSLDGLLDGLYIIRNVVEHVYEDCEKKQLANSNATMAATLNVLDFFLTRGILNYCCYLLV